MEQQRKKKATTKFRGATTLSGQMPLNMVCTFLCVTPAFLYDKTFWYFILKTATISDMHENN